MSELKRYRKKPIVIIAYIAETEEMIPTLEGDMKAKIGDYVVTGVEGEMYPVKPNIFKKIYEYVDGTEIK